MNHLVSYKMYEAEQTGFMANTTMEALTTYHKCNNCDNMFIVCNKSVEKCDKCGSDNINTISDFDYFADLKNKIEKPEYLKELKKKRTREETFIDLVELGNLNKIRQKRRNIN